MEPTIVPGLSEVPAKLLDRYLVDPFFRFLEHRSPRTRALIVVGCGTLLLASAVWAIWSMNAYSRFMAATFEQRLEGGEQAYSGLEAYLLSSIHHTARGVWDDEAGAEGVRRLRARMDSLSLTSQAHVLKRDLKFVACPRRPTSPRADDTPDVRRTFFSASDSLGTGLPAFLFMPSVLVDVNAITRMDTTTGHSREIWGALDRSPARLHELAAAYESESLLVQLDALTIDSLKVVQSYFIGDMGTLLIRDNGKREASTYRKQFRPSRYFPERPYFTKTGDEDNRLGSFSYVSQPYIDYGGKGIVRTYTLHLQLPDGHHAMIGIDCQCPGGVEQIESRLKSLRQPWALLEKDRSTRFELTSSGRLVPLGAGEIQRWFQQAVDPENGKLPDVQGRIVSDHEFGVEGETYEFAIPLEPGRSRGGDSSTRYALAVLDLNAMRNVWIPGAVCVVLCILFGGVLHFYYHQHISQRREQEAVLRRMAQILEEAETPFAWFDGQNRFQRANLAMARALGFAHVRELIFKPTGGRRTFREMLWLGDQGAYEAMLRRSAAGEHTAPYWCRLHGRHGLVQVRVHGERMPLTGTRKGEGPHRFGVLLDYPGRTPSRNVAQPE